MTRGHDYGTVHTESLTIGDRLERVTAAAILAILPGVALTVAPAGWLIIDWLRRLTP